MKKSILRTSFIIVLVLALMGLTLSSFAYWDQLTTNTDDPQEVVIGEGATISIDVEVNESEKVLVPHGAVKDSGDTYEIVYTYIVKLSKQSKQDLNLSAYIDNILVGGKDKYAGLFSIVPSIGNDGKVNKEGTIVTVTVTMPNEPAEEDYEDVANKKLSFTLNITAAQV